ncbi:SH3 domain-containing protein [Neobacillus notoginsengisoli]|uniref:SH3 domain-containing protein n=1 Tax=Neobacillus notoginsengisoli TaxID=1578198 RepID=A0A417YR06_9BACI|nr:SH3 domain-containing protein [Neobacillus notoginsengisoli]RHW37275.1 SH3 domain-containing protein [Neobacillus notoginsengisoli]
MKFYKKLAAAGVLAASVTAGAVMFTPDSMNASSNVVLASVDWVKAQLSPINSKVSSLESKVTTLEGRVASQQTELNSLKAQVEKLAQGGSSTPPPPATSTPTLPSTVYVSKSSVTIHSGATTSYKVVATQTAGTALKVVDSFKSTNGIWYRVQLSSSLFGWVFSGDVSTTKVAVTQPTQVIAKSTANVRKGASTSYASVASLKAGTVTKYLGTFKNSKGETWYNVQLSSGVKGWVISTLCEVK